MRTSRERSIWSLFEAVHIVSYFAQESRDALTAAGWHGFWRGYFASRSAPLGAVSAAPVLASFFSFAPVMVDRAMPAVWSFGSPEAALQARVDGAVAALEVLLAGEPAERIAETVDLLEAAVATLEPAGRVLGAANLALAAYEHPLARLWQATTTLREHRGDGHIAALVAVALGPTETLALRCGMDLDRSRVQSARGWTDEQWAAAQARLADRGLLDPVGAITADGRDLFADVEGATDLAAAAPWDELGPVAVRRLTELLTPLARKCVAVLPEGNPIGLAAPA